MSNSSSHEPRLPTTGPKLPPRKRTDFGAAFTDGADRYRAVRPSYPEDALDFILGDTAKAEAAEESRVVELGAGSGQLTQKLLQRGYRVHATEPSAPMLRALSTHLGHHENLEASVAAAEDTGLPAGSADIVVAAQAWHWFDVPAATAEAARISVPQARLGLIWNQLDVSQPWVHRLSRIMHAGDVHGIEWRPPLQPGYYGPAEMFHTYWSQSMDIERIVQLAQTRTYWLKAKDATRKRVEENIRWYLREETGFGDDDTIDLPYRCSALRTNLLPQPA
ncbi:class I SAM-dependent methyltransferase [Micrococcoides hystricis]|uniref:Class I SAM-dependent methyltransferase n=1 Tax=Micrococcoides hystricis TaxID=1572761 RepID=A0ABV6P8M6_9MICC